MSNLIITPHEPPNMRAWIRMRAYHLAIADIGRGEEPWTPGGPIKNNDGPFLVNEVRPNDGTGLGADTGGAWCVSWVSAKYILALRDAEVMFGITGLRLGFKTSRSALRLYRRMESVSTVIVDPHQAQEGDVFFKERDGGGHGGFVRGPMIGARLPTLEGNVGDVPALVKPMSRNPASLLAILRYE